MWQDSRSERHEWLMPGGRRRVPHFDVATVDGRRVRYAEGIWQRRNLVLVLLPEVESPDARRYLAALRTAASDLAGLKATLVVTSEAVGNLQPPAALVADEWGEIAHVEAPGDRRISSLSSPAALVARVDYLSVRCPECEGEVF